MLKKIGLYFLILIFSNSPSFSLTEREETLFYDGFDTGYYTGIFSSICSLFKDGILSEKEAKDSFIQYIESMDKSISNKFTKENILRFGIDGNAGIRDCRKRFLP